MQQKPLVFLGAGGHAKVLLSLVKACHLDVLGVSAPEFETTNALQWRGVRVVQSDGIGQDAVIPYTPDQVDLVNAVGDRAIRTRLFLQYQSLGYQFRTLIHPMAFVDESAQLGEGVQVMAGAVIQADAIVGQNVILNTKASIDHDCVIEDHVHIAPGAVLCGQVFVKTGALIAAQAVVATGVRVGEYAIAGAGVSVVRDIQANKTVLPAAIRY